MIKLRGWIAFMLIPVLLAAGVIVYQIIYNKTPDYLKDEYIPKGYKYTDGFSFAGREYCEYNYYNYFDTPKLNESFAAADKLTAESLKEDAEAFEKWIDEYKFSEVVSEGDYYYRIYYDADGNETDSLKHSEKLYLFDAQTNTLYYFYYSE